ncbi:hypothetical protein B7G68_15565 [Caulobacter segnis]|uniref:Alginate export domain-containing protein n=2 Tax=Caulobacter segnis TaxID=88688 RepID=D5VLV6_CAUST|nr:alginate export family protein [Caulobacter segnis]ADG11479.1 conserved hypothetical protein [Caulobacter segnis ATCC 21756]AVQ03138.1 hypothetical protein B7G68_15565 [Caulobacter segnis]MDR6626913.1 hypothetical protein [Caulobacter segnis]
MRQHVLLALAGVSALAFAASARAAEAPAQTGQLLLEARTRYELYDPDGPNAEAVTTRLRLGWRQPLAKTLTALIEMEAVRALVDDYADGVHAKSGKATLPDPETVELNRAALEWKPTAAVGVDVGRQRIVFGNARFVGNSGWRQNEQTFDAVKLTAKPAQSVTLTYAYADRVRRPLGRKSSQGVWRGDAHMLHAEADLGAIGRATAYAVLLDFDNAASQSSKTFGARLAGARVLGPGLSGTWELEHAHQTDWGGNPQGFSLDYDVAALGLKTTRSALSLNLERLEGDGVHAFQTPLASLHGFQGLSDVIGATPAKGVRDVFLRGTTTVGVKQPLKLTGEAHDFDTTVGSQNLGREVDAMVSTPIAKGWTFELGVARFETQSRTYPDATRAWVSLDFKL